MHRIDNGWPTDERNVLRVLPLSSVPSPAGAPEPSRFDHIQQRVLSPEIQSLIARYKPHNEKLLYDLVYDELKKHDMHIMSKRRAELTRLRFHLSLRKLSDSL